MKTLIAVFLSIAACCCQQVITEGRAKVNALQEQMAVLNHEGKYLEGIAVGKAAVKLAQSVLGTRHPDTAIIMSNLADLYRLEAQFTDAEPLYQQAKDILEETRGRDNPDTAKALNGLALLYQAQGRYAIAEQALLDVKAISERVYGSDNLATAVVLYNLAELHRLQGEYEKAISVSSRAIAILINDQAKHAALRLNKQAAPRLKLLPLDPPPDFTSLVATRRAMSMILLQEMALLPEHGDLASLAATPENEIAFARSENQMALLNSAQGRYADAEGELEIARNIIRHYDGPGHPETAIALLNQANFYTSQDQYTKAESLYLEARTIFERTLGPDHPNTAAALDGLASMYQSEGEYAKAEPLYQLSLNIRKRTLGPEHPDTAGTMNNLAVVFAALGRSAEAEQLSVNGLDAFEKAYGGSNPLTARARSGLASIYESQGQYAKAAVLYGNAIAALDEVLGPAHPMTAETRDRLAILLGEIGKVEAAQEILLQGWDQRLQWLQRSLLFGRAAAQRNYLRDFRAQLSVLISMQGAEHRVRELGLRALLITKGRVLEESASALNTLKTSPATNILAKVDELQALWVQRGALARRQDPFTAGTVKSELAEIDTKEDQLLLDLSQHNASKELVGTPKISELRAGLGSAVLVEMAEFDELYTHARDGRRWGPSRYGAYVLAATGNVLWQDLGPAASIDVLVRRYLKAMALPANQAVAQDAARQLDALVLAPIRHALPQVTDFYIAPDGLLRLVPFAALIGTDGKPLMENYRIHTLSTGRDLTRSSPVHSLQPAMVGGLTEFGPSGEGLAFPRLPGAREEARDVARIISPKPQELTEDQMTKQFLMQQMNGPRILHLATHGYYSGQTGGLALKDANLGPAHILNQEEAAGLRLQGTQLVVLSACETALGDVSFADGVIGLQRSLTLAGARSQILTLWPVNDAKTKDLMVAFYRNLFEKKMTKSEALRQAQLEMVHQGVDPYYWAPFVLYGDGGPLGE
jgi:CHAT domain-containing protein/tetratricopeptide (TPR) repeat protein